MGRTVQVNVKSRKKKQKGDEECEVDQGVQFETNIAFLIFQQHSVMQNWWAQTEARFKRGLVGY